MSASVLASHTVPRSGSYADEGLEADGACDAHVAGFDGEAVDADLAAPVAAAVVAVVEHDENVDRDGGQPGGPLDGDQAVARRRSSLWAGTTTPTRLICGCSRPDQPGPGGDRAVVTAPHRQPEVRLDMAADPVQSVIGGGLLDDVVDVVAGEGVVLDGVTPVDGDEIAGGWSRPGVASCWQSFSSR